MYEQLTDHLQIILNNTNAELSLLNKRDEAMAANNPYYTRDRHAHDRLEENKSAVINAIVLCGMLDKVEESKR